jgi:hypothetical protein
MTAPENALLDLVATVTLAPPRVAATTLTGDFPGERSAGLAALAGLVRQAPLTHADRIRLLELLADGLRDVPTSQLLAAGHLMRTSAPRFPLGSPVSLPQFDPALTGALATLFTLDKVVSAPWTLIGGLMVLLHCAEHGVAFRRATADADVAVGVFTHRDALTQVTAALRGMRFSDATPDPLAGGQRLSYRWSRGQVHVDVAVPAKVNAQLHVPRSASRLPGVELPALQQALRRSERLQVTVADGPSGYLRRPDLLGALVVKAQAAISDSRDTDRHRGDLVALCEALAMSGAHTTFRAQLRDKDRRRLRQAAATIRPAMWRQCADEAAARGALSYLLGDPPR